VKTILDVLARRVLPLLLSLIGLSAVGLTLTVGSVGGTVGDHVPVPITVDDPSGIACASFMVSYDTGALELTSVVSNFFAPFAQQFAGISPPPETTVEVGGVTYTQPIVAAPVAGGIALAAARGDGVCTNPTLFVLGFRIKQPGQHAVNLRQTVVDNEDAGYPVGGEPLPYLTGVAGGLVDPTEPLRFWAMSVDTIVPGTVGGDVVPLDTDEDGLPDTWEEDQGLDPGSAVGDNGAGGDPDRDEYTNLEEYSGDSSATDPEDIPSADQWLVPLEIASRQIGARDEFVTISHLFFGMKHGASDGYDPYLDEWADVSGPAQAQACFEDLTGFSFFNHDTRAASAEADWRLRVRIPPGQELRIRWDTEALPRHIAFRWQEADDLWFPARADFDFRGGEITVSNDGEGDVLSYYLIHAHVPQEPVAFQYDLLGKRWYLLSLPIFPGFVRAADLIPGLLAAWRWDANDGYYVETQRLRLRTGFWIMVAEDVVVDVTGTPAGSSWVRLLHRWNLVGVAGDSPRTVPAEAESCWCWDALRKFFQWPDNDACEPGLGYWMWPTAEADIWTD